VNRWLQRHRSGPVFFVAGGGIPPAYLLTKFSDWLPPVPRMVDAASLAARNCKDLYVMIRHLTVTWAPNYILCSSDGCNGRFDFAGDMHGSEETP